MVRIISISDEVYDELSRIKNGKSFTKLLKELISECKNKGDPNSILSFLNTREPISEESAKAITTSMLKGRKTAVTRKFSREEQ